MIKVSSPSRMNWQFFCSLIVGLICLGSAASALANSPVFEVYDSKNKKTIACMKVNGRWEAGDRVKKGRSFVAYKDQIASLKKELKQQGTTPNRKKRITKNLQGLVEKLPAQKRLCKQNAGKKPSPAPTPVGTVTPGATPSATPTPKSGCSQACFNQSRLTSCFGIPSGTQGSETNGQYLWATCAGCHAESTRRNRSFSSIRTAFQTIPQMIPFSSSFDTQDMADLAAYLNRYNPKQCRTDWP